MSSASQSINRRQFLKCAAAGAAWLAAPNPAPARRGAKKKPNVLFFAIDDLNDWVACLGGHPDVKTPNLDRLAKRGVLFTNAHCSAPACNPSRASLMTGILPSTSGVYHNPHPWRKSPVLEDAVTIPQHFMAHGYSAVGGGKIYHGGFPDPPSWQDYFPSQRQNKPNDPTPPNRPLNGIPNTAHFDWGPVDVPDEKMGDRQVADWAISQLRKKHRKPFFIACGFFRPHLPWYVPKKYFDMYPADKVTLPNVNENDLDDVPPLGVKMAKPQGDHKKVIEHKQWRKAVQGYLASITFTDTCLGRVLDAFDKSDYTDNTVVVLWSDHGWHLGEKLHWGDPQCPDDGRPGRHKTVRPMPATRLHARYIPDSHRALRPDREKRARRKIARPPAQGPRGQMGPAGTDYPRPKQPLPADREVAIHPVQRRHRRTLRPPEGPDGMDQSGQRPQIRRRQERPRKMAP